MSERPQPHPINASRVSFVSGDYDFRDFCRNVLGREFLEVIRIASAEAACARSLNRRMTKEDDFPKGSLGATYCEYLQLLVAALVNGTISLDATPGFLSASKPLLEHLLGKYDIGDLRKFLPLINNLIPPTEEDTDSTVPKVWDLPEDLVPLVVSASREEVERMDTWPALSVLNQLTASPATARSFVDRVEIVFEGYDDSTLELFEMEEVRNFVHELDKKFPFWLFFLSKELSGLQCVMLCSLPSYLTDQGKTEVFPRRIERLLTDRWFPAMNYMCEYAKIIEGEIEQMTENVFTYIEKGPLRRES